MTQTRKAFDGRPWLVLATIGVVVLFVAFNFARWFFPARVVELVDVPWQVEAVNRNPIAELTATLTLRDNEAVLESACGRRTFGWDLDTDGTAIGFGLVATSPQACSDVAKAEEERVVEALSSVTHWAINSDDVIEFKGGSTVHLTRVGAPARAQVT